MDEGIRMRCRVAAFCGAFLIVMLIAADPSQAWLYYHKPAFKGKVVAAETGQPMEGVVVVVVYYKTLEAGFEPLTSAIAVKETLTDKNGVFNIPSYSTLISPLSKTSHVKFVIYKPGYSKYRPVGMKSQEAFGLDIQEKFFSEDFLKEKTLAMQYYNVDKKESEGGYFKFVFGLVELQKLVLKTREELLNSEPHLSELIDYAESLPIFHKTLNEGRKIFDR